MTFFIAFALAAALLLVFVLWRRAQSHRQEHYRQWVRIHEALGAKDYETALDIAARLRGTPNDASLYDAVRSSVQALRQHGLEEATSRREFEDVLASLQDGVLVVDQESRLRFLNLAAVHMFEVRYEDVLGALLLEALPSFGLETAVRSALQDGRSVAHEVTLYAPKVREVLLRVSPVRRGDGTTSGAVAILQDLTEMRRLERVRRDFVANASHELRTPIANIRAGAETIISAGNDPGLSERLLPRLVDEAERLSRLVSDLLDLARADAQNEVPRTVVDLPKVVQSVADRLSEKASKQEISVTCDCADEVQIQGDPASLEQVAFNLLDNALSYTPPGGQVTLRVRRASDSHLELPDDEEQATENNDSHVKDVLLPRSTLHVATLSVADTGIGIPPQDLQRIFERFYRVDKARSRSQGGTGLGLAIVKHIVENHGGHVRAESEPGKGTTFTVTLPAA